MKKMKTLCTLSCVALLSIQALQAEKVLFLTNQVPTVNQADLTVIEALEDEAYDVEVKLSQQFDKSTDLDGVDCIYVEYEPGVENYVNRIYVSVENGLLIGSEAYENDVLIYRMYSQPELGDQDQSLFTPPES